LSESEKEFEYYDAKATLYRDLTTVLSIVAGFLSVALFTGNVDTSPSSPNFVLNQHYLLIYPVLVFAGLVALFGWRMVHWDRKRIKSKRLKT
jgi:hypothetical protein